MWKTQNRHSSSGNATVALDHGLALVAAGGRVDIVQRLATSDDEGPLERVSQTQPYQRPGEENAQHIANMRSNFAIDDMHAQANDLGLQQRYIEGDVALADMVTISRANWQNRTVSPGANDHPPCGCIFTDGHATTQKVVSSKVSAHPVRRPSSVRCAQGALEPIHSERSYQLTSCTPSTIPFAGDYFGRKARPGRRLTVLYHLWIDVKILGNTKARQRHKGYKRLVIPTLGAKKLGISKKSLAFESSAG